VLVVQKEAEGYLGAFRAEVEDQGGVLLTLGAIVIALDRQQSKNTGALPLAHANFNLPAVASSIGEAGQLQPVGLISTQGQVSSAPAAACETLHLRVSDSSS